LTQELLDEPWQHLHIAAAFESFEKIVGDFEANFDSVPESFKSDWLRDKKLFSIANKAKLARTEKAQAWLQEYSN